MVADVTLPTSTADAGESGFKIASLLGIVRRKIWLMVGLGVATGAIMMVQNAQEVPTYRASFRLLVEPVREQKGLSQLTDEEGAKPQELDYTTQVEVLLSPEVLDPILTTVSERYPDVNYGSIIYDLAVYRLGETKILEVNYTHSNPDKVNALLAALSQGYLNYSLESQRAQLLQGLSFVDERIPPLQERVFELQGAIQGLQESYGFLDPDDYALELFSQQAQVQQQRQILRLEFLDLEAQYLHLQAQAGASAALRQSAAYESLRQEYQVLRQQLAVQSATYGPNSPTIELIERQQANLAPLLFEEAERVLRDQMAQLQSAMGSLAERDAELAAAEQQLRQQVENVPQVARTYQDLQRELALASNSLTRFQETKESLQVKASQNEVPWQLITPPTAPARRPGTSPVKALATGLMAGAALGLALGYAVEKLENTYYTLAEVKKRVPLPVLGTIPLYPDLLDAMPEGHRVDLRFTQPTLTLTDDASQLKTKLKQAISTDLPPRWQQYVRPTGGVPLSGGRPPQVLGHHTPVGQSPPEMAAAKDLSNGLSPAASVFPLGNGSTSNGNSNGDVNGNHQGNDLDGDLAKDRWLMEYDSYGFLESFRTLHANLRTLPLRSMVITSALPGEGATTVAVHLVQAAAAMGRRVLLVDAQYRRGGTRLSSLLGLQERPGLSDYINQQATMNDVIQRLAWESNLFAISSGSETQDPTRLLATYPMQELMERSHKSFDLVVYTLPPLMGLADVGLVAARTDGVLLVTALGRRQSARALDHSLERLKVAHIPVAGLVVNRVKNHSVDLYARPS